MFDGLRIILFGMICGMIKIIYIIENLINSTKKNKSNKYLLL